MDVQQLSAAFKSAYPGTEPAGIVAAPGRVNLIGEHVDYSGLSVLPMAIDRHVYVAFAPRQDPTINLMNADDRFEAVSFDASESIEPADPGHWSNYVRASVQALTAGMGVASGMDVLVATDLPAAAGLSSSTALVVGSAMAYLACGDQRPADETARKELAALLAEGERCVGTQSGGMDHAAILLGQDGHAIKIDFEPLRCEPVPLPDDIAIIVCNSGVVAEKGGDSQSLYNRGPALCRIIRAMVEKFAQSEFGDEIELPTLGEIWHGPLCLTHSEAKDLFEGAITKPNYTQKEIAAYLDLGTDVIQAELLGGIDDAATDFPLQAWARHQYEEHRRVEQMRDALLCNDAETAGRLMNESHTSCAEGLCVSTPELDALVDVARSNGAFGARLTGAGFGGCTVNLVHSDKTAEISESIWQQFYLDGIGKGAGFKNQADAIFEVKAATAADYR